MEPRTIDNLGIDPHLDYAKREGITADVNISDSQRISSQTQIDISSPLLEQQYDLLFQVHQRNLPWGGVEKPQGFEVQKERIFTFQVAPSIGSEEMHEVQLKRISDHIAHFHGPQSSNMEQNEAIEGEIKEEEQQSEQQGFDGQNQDQKNIDQPSIENTNVSKQAIGEMMDAQKEAEILKKMLESLMELDKILIEVNKKRKQYQKG